jgi:hypothetical protein
MSKTTAEEGAPDIGKRWPPEETRTHLRAARDELRQAYRAWMPPEFVEHRRAARREMLLAARSLINRALERIEAKEEA